MRTITFKKYVISFKVFDVPSRRTAKTSPKQTKQLYTRTREVFAKGATDACVRARQAFAFLKGRKITVALKHG